MDTEGGFWLKAEESWQIHVRVIKHKNSLRTIIPWNNFLLYLQFKEYNDTPF